MAFKICTLLLPVLLVAAVQPSHGRNIDLANGGMWEFSNPGSTISRYIKLTTALQLTDTCSWKAEQMRLGLTRSYLTSSVFSIWTWMRKISNNNEPICNANKLTVCSQELGQCVCGEPYLLLNLSANRQKYVIEDGTCRWDEGSACVMEDFAKQIQSRSGYKFELNSKCKQGTACRTKSTGLTCSSSNLIGEFIRSGTLSTNTTVVTAAIYSGNICSCQAIDPASKSQESSADFELLNSVNGDNSYGRSKRDTSRVQLMDLIPPYVNL